jgi:hypothetical protein
LNAGGLWNNWRLGLVYVHVNRMNTMSKNELPIGWTEITPASKRCIVGACPAVFKNEQGQLIVIGRMLTADEANSSLGGRIGDGEIAIEISPEFFSNLGAN